MVNIPRYCSRRCNTPVFGENGGTLQSLRASIVLFLKKYISWFHSLAQVFFWKMCYILDSFLKTSGESTI